MAAYARRTKDTKLNPSRTERLATIAAVRRFIVVLLVVDAVRSPPHPAPAGMGGRLRWLGQGIEPMRCA